ncbi:cellulose binding domain-containing protein [Phytomonospora endophytica]|uniref:CBM2 domain-containing protein n=1 Tax=Phytomonospora endophytica TaxID=714109 RepID=A0A841FTL1_9ACTN|nr:cellulose binding domain-containing protein [Phytomonospora endophytica]MBB6039665.1 hypothetical protein [Phytomonospora endophytica]GIG65616.1 hypothetical protein Pen01_19110 [Phytomonospora endophytica]
MSGARRRWTFGSWPSIITVFTVLTVVFLAVWLISQSSAGAPRPEGNDDFPVVPDYIGPTPDPRESDAEGSLSPASPSPSPSSKSPTPPPPPPEEPDPEPLRADVSTGDPDWLGEVDSTVVVANPNDEDVDGWTVVIVLSDGMTVIDAEGATYSVDGQKVTFKPDGNAVVPGGGDIEFYFSGHGSDDSSNDVRSCRINGHRC